jgi:hypothetical protein
MGVNLMKYMSEESTELLKAFSQTTNKGNAVNLSPADQMIWNQFIIRTYINKELNLGAPIKQFFEENCNEGFTWSRLHEYEFAVALLAQYDRER